MLLQSNVIIFRYSGIVKPFCFANSTLEENLLCCRKVIAISKLLHRSGDAMCCYAIGWQTLRNCYAVAKFPYRQTHDKIGEVERGQDTVSGAKMALTH